MIERAIRVYMNLWFCNQKIDFILIFFQGIQKLLDYTKITKKNTKTFENLVKLVPITIVILASLHLAHLETLKINDGGYFSPT